MSTEAQGHSWREYTSPISGLPCRICQRCGALWEYRGQWDGNFEHAQTWDWDPRPTQACRGTR